MTNPEAGNVEAAIYARHSKDLIVPECKDGPTWGGGHRRLDYWVLRRSWTSPAMIGYEVKSGRRDWLSDTKWQEYLPLCNELWFIAPKDAILLDELPAEVGLLRPTRARLITVRRAVWREVAVPDGLLTYVLMCRTKITKDRGLGEDGRSDYWREWLERKAEDQRIGYDVSKRLREKYERDVQDVRRRNDTLAEQVAKLTAIRDALDARGIHWDRWGSAERIIDEQVVVQTWARREVEGAREALSRLLEPAGKPRFVP